MRLPIYLICAALVLAIEAEENAVDYYGSFLEPMKIATERDPLSNYVLPKVSAKYRPEWVRLADPAYFATDDINTDADRLGPFRKNLVKKQYESFVDDGYKPSLSIKAPIEVLRNKMYLQNLQRMVERNKNFLRSY